MRSALALTLCMLAGSAHADRRSDALVKSLSPVFGFEDGKLPRIAFVDTETKLTIDKPLFEGPVVAWEPLQPVIAFSADGKVGWIATGLADVVICGMGDCEKVRRNAQREAERKPPYHLSALVDGDQPIFVHFGNTGTGVGHGDPIAAQIEDDAKPVVELFQKTIGDAKVFAATVSPRKDAALLGTEANERFVGGTAARATLVKWGLSLKTVGGIRAGTTKSKTIAWILADVEAMSRTAKKATPYRVSVVYEKTGDEWKIVQLHFT